MRDQYRALMLTSFKDAIEIVEEMNGWTEEAEFENAGVPGAVVPQIALSLYRGRVMEARSESSFDLPELDERMYE